MTQYLPTIMAAILMAGWSGEALATTTPPSVSVAARPPAAQASDTGFTKNGVSKAFDPQLIPKPSTTPVPPPAPLLQAVPPVRPESASGVDPIPQNRSPSAFDPGPGDPAVPVPYPTFAPSQPEAFQRLAPLHGVVVLLRYTDPGIPGIFCMMTGPTTNDGTGSTVPLIGLSCHARPGVQIPPGLPAQEALPLPGNATIWLDRSYDPQTHAVVYTAVSKQAAQGLHYSAVSVVVPTEPY